MKRPMAMSLAICLGAVTLSAGPAEDAIMAAVRLSDQPNYSWIATVSDDARTYDVEGRIDRSGFTQVRMPVVNAVRRKLGRSVGDTQVEFVFRGNTECVIATDEGWRRPDELREPAEIDAEFERIVSPTGPIGLSSGSVRPRVLSSSRTRGSRGSEDGERRPYSNLQLAISPPHEELGVIISSHQSFEVDGDTVSGQLTELGAQLLLVRDGQREITPIRAGGTFKLWIRGGHVTRYQLRLEGTLSVETPRGRSHVAVHQTSLTHIKDMGSTRVDVPAEAQAKLLRRR